jgi:hypothetical protein
MTFTAEKDVMVAMRDGVELATDAWIPSVTPAPTLLVRLPYGKDLAQLSQPADPARHQPVASAWTAPAISSGISLFRQDHEAGAGPGHHLLRASSSTGLHRHQTLSRLVHRRPEPGRSRC